MTVGVGLVLAALAAALIVTAGIVLLDRIRHRRWLKSMEQRYGPERAAIMAAEFHLNREHRTPWRQLNALRRRNPESEG